MPPKKISVLMLDGESDFAIFAARCLAQTPEVELHVLSVSPWTPLQFSRRRQSFILQKKGEDRLAAIRRAVKSVSPDVILPVDEPATQFVIEHLLKFQEMAALPPLPEKSVFKTLTNKWQLAQMLRKNRLSGPATILYTANQDFERQAAALHFPVLLKPAQGRGGEGIRRFDAPADLLAYLTENPPSAQYIVQEFITGYDVDCSVLCKDGKILAYTIQQGVISGAESFAAPAGIDFIWNEQVFDLVARALSAVNFSGIAHLDLRYDAQAKEVKLIEVNARYWGSLIGSLIVGVNFPYLACLAALNIPFTRPEYCFERYVAPGAALKEIKRSLLNRQKRNFSYRNTGLPYALTDPIAEAVKMIRQAFSEHR